MLKKTRIQPIREIPRTPVETMLMLVAALSVLFMIVTTVDAWDELPEVIPTHFNAAAEADGWGSRGTILILPIVGAVSVVGLSLLRRIPHKFNYPFAITEENAERQYQLAILMIAAISAEVALLFAVLTYETIQVALLKASTLSPAVWIFFGLTMLTVVLYFLQAWKNR